MPRRHLRSSSRVKPDIGKGRVPNHPTFEAPPTARLRSPFIMLLVAMPMPPDISSVTVIMNCYAVPVARLGGLLAQPWRACKMTSIAELDW